MAERHQDKGFVINGNQSTWTDVKSGLQQGTVVGLLGIVTNITDVDDNITSKLSIC